MKLLNLQQLEELSNLFKSVGDIKRLRILLALREGEIQVSLLANKLEMSISALSHQLKVLRIARLVKSEKKGKEVYYQLADDHVLNILVTGCDHILEDEETNL